MTVDTDILIRFFTKDDATKAQSFKKFLLQGTKIKLTDVTVAEVFWTLNSFYKLDKATIITLLQSLIDHSSVSCNKNLLQEALNILKNNNLSFVDSYTAAYSQLQDDSQLLSYDRGFDKLPSITRTEP